jgi:hypothetical protein
MPNSGELLVLGQQKSSETFCNVAAIVLSFDFIYDMGTYKV